MKRHERINRGIFSTITAQDTRPACEGCDTDYWFSTIVAERKLAQRICETCPIKQRCLADALYAESLGPITRDTIKGVFGGLTARARLPLITPRCPDCHEPREQRSVRCAACALVAKQQTATKHNANRRITRGSAA